MRQQPERASRMPRSSSAMIALTCQHLCTTAAVGQQYLADVATGRAPGDPRREAAAEAAQARLRSCVCPGTITAVNR